MRVMLNLASILTCAFAVSGCTDFLIGNSTKNVQNKPFSYKQGQYEYSLDDEGESERRVYRENALRTEILRKHYEERARLERQAREARISLEHARNVSERARLEKELQEKEAQAAKARRETHEAELRAQQRIQDEQLQKIQAVEAKNRAQDELRAEIERRTKAQSEEARLKKELGLEKERKKQAIDAQISADRALAEKLQAEENARFKLESEQRRKLEAERAAKIERERHSVDAAPAAQTAG